MNTIRVSYRFAKYQFCTMALLCIGIATHAQETLSLASPDGNIQTEITLPHPGSSKDLHWSAKRNEKPLLEKCEINLSSPEHGDLLKSAKWLYSTRRSQDTRIPVLFGKSSHANDTFNELRLAFTAKETLQVDIVFRCYSNAVALRYEVKSDQDQEKIIISDEGTSFQLAGNPTTFVQYLEHYKTSHEHEVDVIPYDAIPSNQLLDTPLTAFWSDKSSVAITESALRNYAGMALMRSAQTGAFVSKLTPRPDGNKVEATLPLKTPWRVVLIGDQPGDLLESNTLYCLNEPSAIADTSWIKPDRLTFHWWNGDVYDGKPGASPLSFETNKKYIDFCARKGLPIHSITSTESPTTPWYHQSKRGVAPGPDTNVTRPRNGFDLPRIMEYAKSKGIRLWTWVHQAALRGRVEEAFAAFEKMGWSGMMVDFIDHDDQDHVKFTEEILKAAARHHILIHFHGVWKPTGLERTYPNLMNHEGALNLEYLKWSDRCTPEHNLRMAFTRLIAGPMDYHLGGFRSLPPDQFKPRQIAPHVLGTRGHMLAMYVCFDNPAPMIADYPTAYEGQPGFDFLQTVPTWWDETKVLQTEIGELLVVARRKGQDWYLGGMSGGQPHQISLPLNFLKQAEYKTTIWRDMGAPEANPNHLHTETSTISSDDTLSLQVSRGGGFVARLEANH
jgi:alpha-glucosidase